MLLLTDTHCHIHSADYPLDTTEVEERASSAGVKRMLCVGTDEDDSELAVQFVQNRDNTWATLGLHPHDAAHGVKGIEKLRQLATQPKVVAIGECGLDYFYNHSPRDQQIEMFRSQIQLAQEYNLPMIFHVREAFDDFWPIFDKYHDQKPIRGVLHSFTDTSKSLAKALERDLFVGVNGIATFTKVEAQKEMYASIPLHKLLLETDAPFLTPVPLRGRVNEPAFVKHVAEFLAALRHESLDEIAAATEHNATHLFSFK